MPKPIHEVHKYGRIIQKREGKSDWIFFKCHLPNCPHYLHGEVLVIGRQSICFSCGSTFTMTKNSLMAKPKCLECRTGSPEVDAMSDQILKEMGMK